LKIDQALIFYLLRHKELPLQGIGIFKLEGNIAEPADPGKPIVIPADAISFTYNPRVAEDPDLIAFISETTGKIKPLASADLDSYLTIGRQFINIGKPMILPNIGTLERTNSGELFFKGGQHVMDSSAPTKVEEEIEEHEIEEQPSFADFPSQKKNKARGFLYLLILIILGLTVWAIWKYAFNTTQEETITHTDIEPVQENDNQSIVVRPQTDSANQGKPDSATNNLIPASGANDTIGFKIVVGIYNSLESGTRRLEDMKLSHRNVILYTSDSVRYKVAEPFPNLPLRDTTKIKDSMRAYYGPRNYIIER
jgi:hypothetical protein